MENAVSSACYLTNMLIEEDPIAHKNEIKQNIGKINAQARDISIYATKIIEHKKKFE